MAIGRPTKLDEVIANAIVDATLNGATQKAAAEAAGINQHTIIEWRKRGATGEEPFAAFAARLQKAKGEAQLKMIRVVRDAAEGGAWQAAAWWLERRYHQVWGRKDTLTQRAAITKSTDISDAEYERLLREEVTRLEAKKSA